MNEDLVWAVEAVLFASERPLTAEELCEAFDGVTPSEVSSALAVLAEEYRKQPRGFVMKEIAGGYQLASDERFAPYLKKLYQSREKKRLTQASLETLSVVAYRQPVTRAEIETVRGVNVDGALRTLMEKGFVRIAGRKEAPGRPMLFGTTREFLAHFGLNSLKDLPPLAQYTERDLDPSLVPPELKKTAENGASAKSAMHREGTLQ